MKTLILLLVACFALGHSALPVSAQKAHKPKLKNEFSKLREARKKNRTVRQITVDPKKSPGKHLDDVSKNINREINRESKDVNHFFQGKKKKK